MRRPRVVLACAGLVLVLLVAAVWLAPGMLDWNRYRDGIAALASKQLGKPVHIGGAVSLQLLPQPILIAEDVAVNDQGDATLAGAQTVAPAGAQASAPAGAQAIVLHARALRLRVALVPLLAGKVDARELVLQGADMRLPWPPPAGALAQRPPEWLTGLQAHVEHSRLQVGDLVLDDIDATVTTDPDTGTLSVAGLGQAGTRRWQFTARLTRPGHDGSAALDVSLDGQGGLRDTGGTFSGQIGADGALSGRVSGRGPDLSALMPAPAAAWRGDGQLKASAGLVVADGLALVIGGAPAGGTVALRVLPAMRLDASVSAGRLDLDAWLPALLGPNTRSLRSGVPTGIDLAAEAATLAGGTLRHLRAGIEIGQGPVRLRTLAAVLPGEATLSISGQIEAEQVGAGRIGAGQIGSGTTKPAKIEPGKAESGKAESGKGEAGTIKPGNTGDEPRPRLDGVLHVAAPDMGATLRWLRPLLPGWVGNLPPTVLRTAEVSAHVVADAGQVALSDLRATVDGAQWSGAAALRMGTRPAFTAALTVDRLAADPFVPAMTATNVWQKSLSALRAVDADVKLEVRRAEWAGVALGAVAIELQSDVARVLLRRLEAQPPGARLSISGQVSDAGRLSDGRLELVATDVAALRTVAEETPIGIALAPVSPLLRGAGSLTVGASGTMDALTGRVSLELGDLRIEAQPTVDVVAQRWTGSVTLHHPGAPRLLEGLGVAGAAAWLGDGSLSLVGQLAVTPGRIELAGATLSAGALRAGGTLTLGGNTVSGQVAAETLPLPLVYPRATIVVPVAWLRSIQGALRLEAAQVLVGLSPVLQGLATDVTLDAGMLRFSRVTAQATGAALTGSAALDAAVDPPRLAVQGRLEGLSLSGPVFGSALDVVAGRADVTLDVTATGYSPAALLATVSGSGSVRVQDGVATGIDLAAAAAALEAADPREALPAARAALLSGTTSFSSLGGPVAVARGVATVDATLTASSGSGLLTGTADALSGGVDLVLSLRPLVPGSVPAATKPADGKIAGPDGPVLGLRLTGQAATPTRVPQLAGVARWLADRPLP